MKILIVVIAIFAFPSVLFGVIDFNGNGVSEFWELQYKGVVADDFDSDNDGISNLAEGIAGTDPHDPASVLALEHPVLDGPEVRFSWSAEAGKIYRLERWDPAANGWSEAASILPLNTAEIQTVTLDRLDG
ncbi:MAG: thrombospondin type 3 repeat-containing protein, partial [Akkermansiaceae bacterium]